MFFSAPTGSARNGSAKKQHWNWGPQAGSCEWRSSGKTFSRLFIPSIDRHITYVWTTYQCSPQAYMYSHLRPSGRFRLWPCMLHLRLYVYVPFVDNVSMLALSIHVRSIFLLIFHPVHRPPYHLPVYHLKMLASSIQDSPWTEDDPAC